MRSNEMWRHVATRIVHAGVLVACAALAASPVAAQMTGNLRYVRGYDWVPNPPSAGRPSTLVLYGIHPTGCGVIDEASVQDSARVAIRLRSVATCPDSSIATWAATLSLGVLAAGNHTMAITLTMDRPDSGVTSYEGNLSYSVADSTPPPPPPAPALVTSQTTDPWPPTPLTPMALIVGGYAPFACPVVSAATVIDTSHLALTLSPGSSCGDSSGSWTQRFELGLQREGHHTLDLAITLAGDSVVTHHVPVGFLVVNDTTGSGPPPVDSLQNVLSPSRPNPFVAESRFSISLDEAAEADVAVFDVNGRRVNHVFHGRLTAGTTELAWNGRHEDGSRVPAGIYFYRLAMRGRVISRRLVLLRP